MRTLLNECLPPNLAEASTFSTSEQIAQPLRTFYETVVLVDNTADVLEVGLERTVIATPGARANQANSAPGRGVAPASLNRPQIRPCVKPSEETSAAV